MLKRYEPSRAFGSHSGSHHEPANQPAGGACTCTPAPTHLSAQQAPKLMQLQAKLAQRRGIAAAAAIACRCHCCEVCQEARWVRLPVNSLTLGHITACVHSTRFTRHAGHSVYDAHSECIVRTQHTHAVDKLSLRVGACGQRLGASYAQAAEQLATAAPAEALAAVQQQHSACVRRVGVGRLEPLLQRYRAATKTRTSCSQG